MKITQVNFRSPLLIVGASLIACCNNQPLRNSNISSDTITSAIDSPLVEKPNSENFANRLLFVVNMHKFSDTVEYDSLKLQLFGNSVLKGTIVFSIVDVGGRRIYSDTFPSWDLLGDESEIIPGDQAKVDTIKHRFFDFFAERKFSYPAIRPNDPFDTDNSDSVIWNHVKLSPNAIGFGFNHGYEGYYEIAYDPVKKHVECYYSSD